ncbi:imidazole glycerol phosphate synthase subunit HisH [Suttonella ornithocola]|uniref:Imidazole glycerol phosphate synthase subunit HisH n=1 Tax=Suttonella ornithocola TaxID=279832 RepID=A0A380MMK9_9GAMM|nr:imidazole glycerol phosphate synthase subunit HisH [Suttonella ornithocola]SUO93850.1 Imidazole glycerol phosphate synthase subunit HisH 1 [Suttonella ornithocola]
MKIAIIDYGMGNLHSVYKAMQHVAPTADLIIATTAKDIQAADRILLPGQGAIKGCMDNIRQQDIEEALIRAAKEKPFLGICIGPQLMCAYSEENNGVSGLNLFPDIQVTRFNPQTTPTEEKLKIPHMGWNTIEQTSAHPLWANIPNSSYFYYVHSYHLTANPHTIGETNYGATFPAAIAHENIAGLQAHPEKSANVGLQFLSNFVHWQP